MYQRTIIIGRLGRDPEMRYTAQGTAVTSFSVATDRTWTDQSGQRQERTTWFRISAWGKLAEICNQYLAKGRLVMVEGELQEPKPFQGRDGEWRAGLDLRATNVQFLGGRGDGGGAASAGPQERDTDQGDSGGPILDEEEIPF
jgi:single-strand DNA-binding protein